MGSPSLTAEIPSSASVLLTVVYQLQEPASPFYDFSGSASPEASPSPTPAPSHAHMPSSTTDYAQSLAALCDVRCAYPSADQQTLTHYPGLGILSPASDIARERNLRRCARSASASSIVCIAGAAICTFFRIRATHILWPIYSALRRIRDSASSTASYGFARRPGGSAPRPSCAVLRSI